MQTSLRQRLNGLPPGFHLLMLSDVLSGLAMGAGYVSISWWVVSMGGARDMAWFSTLTALVMLVALPLTAPLGDRFPKNRVIAGGILLAMLSGLALAAMAWFHFYRLAWVVASESMAMFAWAIVIPSMLSIAAELVPANRLSDALSMQKSSQSVGNLIGPVIGGSLMAVAPAWMALGSYTLLLAIAAVGALRIRLPARSLADVRAESFIEQIRSGLRVRWRIPLERRWALWGLLVMTAYFPMVVTLLPIKLHQLGLPAFWLGACEAAVSGGLLVGSLWLTHRLLLHCSRPRARAFAMWALGAVFLVVALTDHPLVMLAMFGIEGALLSITMLIGQTHRTLAVPEPYRARVSAINVLVAKLGGMLGPALAGILLARWSLDEVYLFFALFHLLTVPPMLLLPGVNRFLNLSHDEVKDWYLKQHPEAFEPMAPAGGKLEQSA
ncbi:MFS transporter [Chromobacterium subtsugae]|uniref:MFS transporter n=2 Tax=Chromobacterium subtsugae TaxID=251747 RepID=A0ABS7FJL2_9NEIS|nr:MULTISPECIES: MFS transporter [Chromobacterium]MBW7568132.1 MFS transporter [Chromobacterium subtsugae]MBW8289494.1 MFS transporter [Chromobacterium subtsugae]WSE92044.1 MFS transporter [Chromobacterium subtsugae]WVH60418.1 MFS transporter [Chromobacterium subtsugae]